MRKHLAIALILATSTATAAPRKHRPRLRDTAWLRDCITERVDSGMSRSEARRLCKVEQPDDDVGRAKRELDAAKHKARIAKLADRVARAIEACEEAVSIACEDTTERSSDNGECSDETLRVKHAFDVCTGHGPAWNTKGGN